MFKEAIKSTDSRFKIHAHQWSGLDQQDEEDDNDAAIGEEEGGEEDDFANKKKRNWGSTSFYDPVILKHTNILVPGNTEAQAKYKNSIYCFQDNANRDLFIADPTVFLQANPVTQPPLRLCCIGLFFAK